VTMDASTKFAVAASLVRVPATSGFRIRSLVGFCGDCEPCSCTVVTWKHEKGRYQSGWLACPLASIVSRVATSVI
jgi:hypothetical protein